MTPRPMRISQEGLNFIKGWESFVGWVYDDKVPPVRQPNGKRAYREWDGGIVRGTLTIGYGHTNAAKHPLKIKRGLRITEKEACEILDVDLDDVEAAVNRRVKVPLTQGQFDALVSLTFNMGEGNLAKSSLLARLNDGDYAGARRSFDLYVKSGGEFMQGLQNRRDGEQALWDSRIKVEIPSTDAPEPHPSEVDPPKAPDVKPIGKSKTVWGGILAWIAGTLGGIFQYIATPWGFAALVFIVITSSIGLFLVIKGRLDVQKIVRCLSEETSDV